MGVTDNEALEINCLSLLLCISEERINLFRKKTEYKLNVRAEFLR